MAMFVFQFGFLQPVASMVNSQLPIAGFTLMLLLAVLVNNKFKLKKYVLMTFLISGLTFLACSVFMPNLTKTVLQIYGEFLFKSFSAFVIASIPVDGRELYDAFLRFSIINFLAIVLFPFVNFLDSMNYMRFGYAMAPSVIMFFYACYDSKFKNPIWNILAVISLSLTIIYGSRGAIIVLLLFLLTVAILTQKVAIPTKIFGVFFIGIMAFLLVRSQLIIELLDYIYYQVGIKSYSLNKFRLMLSNGIVESSSGRDVIYLTIIDLIKDKPFIGYGIGIIQQIMDKTAHNMFLQIVVETGIIGLFIWGLIWMFCIKMLIGMKLNNDMGFYRVTILLLSIAFGRLLISSDIWLRPEYWFALSLCISYSLRSKACGVNKCYSSTD